MSIETIKNEQIKERVKSNIEKIVDGERDIYI